MQNKFKKYLRQILKPKSSNLNKKIKDIEPNINIGDNNKVDVVDEFLL